MARYRPHDSSDVRPAETLTNLYCLEDEMRTFRVHGPILTVFLTLVLAGCAAVAITGSTDVEKSAFGSKKRFAVVSISSLKTFSGEKGMTQMFKSTDEIPGANTQPLINTLSPKIINSLRSTGHFSLMSESAVLSARAYRTIKEDERVMKVLFMSDEVNVANGYKYISEPQKFAQLAKDLGVDGVIGVTMSFSISSSKGGVGIMGLSLGRKSYSTMVSASAIAYNRNGNVIWKDTTLKEAEPGDRKAIILIDTTDITKTNFEKFHPSAVEIGGKAVDVLLARFDDTMAGKKVSSMQSVK